MEGTHQKTALKYQLRHQIPINGIEMPKYGIETPSAASLDLHLDGPGLGDEAADEGVGGGGHLPQHLRQLRHLGEGEGREDQIT